MRGTTPPSSRTLTWLVVSPLVAFISAEAAPSRARRVGEERRATSGRSTSCTRIATRVSLFVAAQWESTSAANAGRSGSGIERIGRRRLMPPCNLKMLAASSSFSSSLTHALAAATCSSSEQVCESMRKRASIAPASRIRVLLVSLRATFSMQNAAATRIASVESSRKATNAGIPSASRVAAAAFWSTRQMLTRHATAAVRTVPSVERKSDTSPSMPPSRRHVTAAALKEESSCSASTAPSCTSSADEESNGSSLTVPPTACSSSRANGLMMSSLCAS
eukprot:scaffold41911_cov31-Tisochrysis_lutea.AAC.8